ncbi:hypothetical protein Ga0123462_1882 [Mariprofundus ferrinatatus]|uniref:Uncharacterized protein n=1 Tax=Mariprofundus ferrinatatus TaxID=1921087 RepID=A0A2K8LCU4_9PROT|nr:hypothetical protein [Mariprofundus ferrinatatus]ATX82724.1 hypothetical protein Ga0123462_1882 [Mariprofundus ferrinatatus]
MASDGDVFELTIDKNNIIKHVNDAWLDFANSCNSLLANKSKVLDKPLFTFIDGEMVKNLYLNILLRVRSSEKAFVYKFRCDSPSVRRLLEMKISPLDKQDILFTSCIIKSEHREPVSMLDCSLPRNNEVVFICSICKKIELDCHEWIEIEEALSKDDLFCRDGIPQIANGLCPDCGKHFLDEIEAQLGSY